MKEKITLMAFIALCLALVFFAATGIATSESYKNKLVIDSLRQEVNTLMIEFEELNKADNDTIVVDVKVNPQVIKVYNTCTN